MKRKLLICISVAVTAFSGYSQVSLPNGNFESWTSITFDFPEFYSENSNMQSYAHTGSFNLTKTTDAFHGGFAVQLMTTGTVTDPEMAYMGNFNSASGGSPANWTGGVPISETPTGIRGYYKYNVASGDSAAIAVVARQGGASIGSYIFKLGGVHTSYTLFDFTFSPALPATPDSIIFATASSDFTISNGVPGSTLLLDSLSFSGISVQPAQFNGDFELWQSQAMQFPNSWITDDQSRGVSQTSDAVAGNYAVELETYLGDNNGVPRAGAGQIATGYWDNSCNCEKGGYPFSNQVDTLAFYYKYAPADPNDSAQILLSFKNGGVSFMSNIGMALYASPSYQYMELPINLMSTPDSVIVSIQSSAWGDSALSFVGANLKIDEIHFKSQSLSTGILNMHASNDVNFYPNPFNTIGTIIVGQDINTEGMTITIYDALGKVMKKAMTNEHKITIDRAGMKNGIYFYELKNTEGVIKNGKIIVE